MGKGGRYKEKPYMAAMLFIRCNRHYREKYMNKKIAGIIIVFLIVLGLGISVPGMVTDAGKLIDNKNSQLKDTKAVPKNSGENVPNSEEKEAVKPSDSQSEAQTNQSIAEITKEPDVKSPTVTVKNNQDKSSTSSASTSVKTNNNSNVNQNGSSVNSSGSNTSNTNTGSSQVSRGGSNVDESKYSLLSKVNGSFGQFRYRDLSGGRIEVDPQWVAENIVTITLPGLNRQVQVHKDAADNFITAFNYIKNGTAVVNGQEVSLLSLIKTMDGTYVTRHVNWDPSRGLSNHSWGTAIDINATGHFGYVDPQKDMDDPNLILWEKAFEPAGFSWGNRYSDSMHYELIK